MALRAAVLAATLSLTVQAPAHAAAPKTRDWSNDPASARPAFASSRSICRQLLGTAVPAADLPTPADTARLADCSSEALYFGIGRPVDPTSARLCASVETANADPQVTDFGFTGDRTLMMVYANGVGASRNLPLATALACRAGGTPDEVDARVRHLARLGADGWSGTDFSLCDDASGSAMLAACADHDQLVSRARRSEALAALSAGWSQGDRSALSQLRRIEDAAADAKAQGEIDQSGRDREVRVVAAEDAHGQAFAALLAEVEGGTIPPGSTGDAAAAAGALEDARRTLMAGAAALARTTTITPQGLVTSQRAWSRYRDAWVAFAKQHAPGLSSDALTARLDRDRAADLLEVLRTKGRPQH